MQRFVVIHYGEIALKGDNRGFFERKLVDNIKSALAEFGALKFKNLYGRFIVELINVGDFEAIKNKLQKVFGIEYIALAWNSTLDMEQMTKDAVAILKNEKFKTFRITAKRTIKILLLLLSKSLRN